MDYIFAKTNREDACFCPESAYFDLEIGAGTRNDFEIKIPYASFYGEFMEVNGYFFLPESEYGGLISSVSEDTEEMTITLSGPTWRGLLDQIYIEPPSGQDYRYISGYLGSCLSQLLTAGKAGDIFIAEPFTEVSVSNYKVDRYASFLGVAEKLLAEHGYKLVIKSKTAGTLTVSLYIEPVNDFSEEVEVSQDNLLNFKISQSLPTYTHALLLGKGELKSRIVAYLEWNNGKPRAVSSIPNPAAGRFISVYKYENTGSDDKNKLITDGIEKFLDVNKTDSQSTDTGQSTDIYDIHDILAGRSRFTGITVKAQITQKVISYEDGQFKYSYKIGT